VRKKRGDRFLSQKKGERGGEQKKSAHKKNLVPLFLGGGGGGECTDKKLTVSSLGWRVQNCTKRAHTCCFGVAILVGGRANLFFEDTRHLPSRAVKWLFPISTFKY